MNKKSNSLVQRITLLPYSVWAALFILVPLAFVAYYAFTDSNFNFTMDNVMRFCDRAILIEDGKIACEGKPEKVTKAYNALWQ